MPIPHFATPEPVGVEDLPALFELQKAARWEVARSSVDQRRARLTALYDAIRTDRRGLAEAIRQDFDKHPDETELTEIGLVLEEITHARDHLALWMRPQKVATPLPLAGGSSTIQYEAKGQALLLSPWNYPFQLALVPLVAAVAAGNTVILRPSDKVPRTARRIRDLVSAVFPRREVAVVLGGHDVAEALLAMPFDHVFFTGSSSVGRKVMAAAARHLASVTLELGGKSPVVVDQSADLPATGERLAWAKFVNAGQTCVAPDYVLVHEHVAESLAAEIKAAVQRFYGSTSEAQLASSSYASLVDARSLERLSAGIDEAVEAGARLVTGGLADLERRRLAPTVLLDVPEDAALLRDEIFGPVLPIVRFRRLDEAIDAIRARPKPLALYVFARDEAAIQKVLTSTSAGGTSINNAMVHPANANLPFGGTGESGQGKYHGWFGFEAFSNARAIYRQTLPTSVKVFYPPYGTRTRRALKLLRLVTG